MSQPASTGRVKIDPDIPLSEPDTASMGVARNEDTHANEDAQSGITEASLASH